MFNDSDYKYFNPDEDLNFDENEEQFPQVYDLEEAFDTQIYPLLKSIVNICNEYNIPMLACFQYGFDGKQTMLCTSKVIPEDRVGRKIKTATDYLLARDE